ISASRNLKGRDQQEVIAEVVEELSEIWPTTREAKLIHSRMVTEHQAVFSVQPGIEGLRPGQQSSISNLQYAGDWTNTGWPGTMEGAVRSGYQAAENVLKQLGRPERLVQRDLPTAWLSRLLLGIRSTK
ncbi:MAG: FAD-dependent oxidoreductase, partial [Planctomycetaceae bacterium]|nr:FAD-dependent oxidoreductase [Planctomycetaceae bacterium]